MPELFQGSFAAGELASGLRFRSTLQKWAAGASLIRNMFVHFSGGVSNRAGTQFVGYARVNTDDVRLLPFTFNTAQTYILEFTPGAIRIISQGAYVTSGGVPIQLTTPYTAAALASLRFVQANDILTVCHPDYAAYELRRLGLTSWTFTAITYGTKLAAPTGVTTTPQGGAPPGTPTPSQRSYTYGVTAVSSRPADESALTAAAAVTNYALGYNDQSGVQNVVSWSAVTGAEYYNVYRKWQGVWAFVGSTTDLSFTDVNTLPDTATTPPENDNPFAGGNNPVTVCYHQQRRVFGGAKNFPQALYFSRAGNFDSMDVCQPTRPDDAIVASLVARENNAIRHLIPLQDLLVLTAAAAWTVTGNQGVITPADLIVRPQAYTGASEAQPVTINYDVLYVREGGGGLTGLAYDFNAGGFTTRDLSALSSHLFSGATVKEMAWAGEPHKLLWAVLTDGTMLGFTYLREQDVYAWHRHDTAGRVLSVATVKEGGQDVLYLAVARNIGPGGAQRTTIERMRPRAVNAASYDVREGWFVDCGLQYRGAPATTISGLSHLEGQTVSILADGNVQVPRAVSGGAITLDRAASVVTVGLAYTAELRTLPLDAPGGPSLFGKRKRVSTLRVMMENTRGLEAALLDSGYDPDWREFKERRSEAWGSPTDLLTGSEEVTLPPAWSTEAVLAVRQTRPLPATVLGVMPDVTVGDMG